MPGDPTAFMADSFMGATSAPSPAAQRTGSPGHFGFLVWLVVLGVVLPVFILGGLSVGGFSFVFRHR